MRAKPDMKPWVSIDKSKMSSVGAVLIARVLGYLLWACAAPTGLIYVFPINILYYFDALALYNHSIVFSLDETARRSPKGQVLLVLWWGFAE